MKFILSLAVNLIPLLAIGFVTILIFYKVYVKIRSNFRVTANCWFCNQNTKVPYLEANCFTCPHCDQYNGFTKDGDYNREIYQQLDCSNLSTSRKDDKLHDLADFSDQFPANGFCVVCNEGQRLKVEKLSQFEPKNESKFDEELKAYKNQLEEQYRLCTTCDHHLKRVLREKKKMVLGSKFLEFVKKGADTYKQSHFAQIKIVQKSKLKKKISTYLVILAVVNALCILKNLPGLTKDNVTSVLGDKVGHYTFLMISHVLALVKVFGTYSEVLCNHYTVKKISIFLKTITMMVLYSMGMKLPQMAVLDMTALLVLACPFLMLSLAFIYNLIDGFKLSRFTLMLTLWSLCAGGLLDLDELTTSRDIVLLATSVLTVWLSLSSKSASNVAAINESHDSFHKIFSEDYWSDEEIWEPFNFLNQEHDSSGKSVLSESHMSSINRGRLARSPITSSVLSLNGAQRSPTFKGSWWAEDQPTMRSRVIAASLSDFPTNRSLFASNLELNCNRPLSTFGASSESPLVMNATMSSNNKQSDDSFQKVNHAPRLYANAPLASPFSVSSSAVYQRSNLLTPSRFSTNSLATNNPSASWLSGGYFNSGRTGTVPQSPAEKRNFFLEHRNGMNSIHENISRASSQSSGFESQTSATLRENSTCPDQEQYPPVNSSMSDCHNGFYPIDNSGLFQRPTSLLNTSFQTPMASPVGSLRGFSSAGSQINLNSNLQPLSVNCNQDYWKPMKSHHNSSMSNAFNLRKINEELPPIQRGALLKKWKDGQTL